MLPVLIEKNLCQYYRPSGHQMSPYNVLMVEFRKVIYYLLPNAATALSHKHPVNFLFEII
jgi:hypothetical protein